MLLIHRIEEEKQADMEDWQKAGIRIPYSNLIANEPFSKPS